MTGPMPEPLYWILMGVLVGGLIAVLWYHFKQIK
jgi:hypothetical protein